MEPIYLRLTEEINAIDYLEKAYYFIKQTNTDNMSWKWVAISFFGALYGFAICACRGTDSNNVIKKKTSFLITFDEAINNCQNPEIMNMTIKSKCLVLSNRQKESILQLKSQLRNNFEHYKPCDWLIEIHGFPLIILDVLDIIEFLALEAGNYVHLEKEQERKIKSIICELKRILKNHKLYKDVETIK